MLLRSVRTLSLPLRSGGSKLGRQVETSRRHFAKRAHLRTGPRGDSNLRVAKGSTVSVPELCTTEGLSQKLFVPVPELLDKIASLGEKVEHPSSPLSAEQIELLGMELGVSLVIKSVDAHSRPTPTYDEAAALPFRPPVVTLMGHVSAARFEPTAFRLHVSRPIWCQKAGV